MPIRIFAILLSLIALLAACKSMDTRAPVNTNGTSISTPVPAPRAAPTVAATTVKGKIDPCSLLSNDDIKAVQGEQPTQTQRSDRADSGYIVSQCYYAAPTTSDSVVLNVTTAAEGANARHPRDFWKKTFADNEAKDKKRDREGKERKGEEEEAVKPEKITGVGDDAYWSASRVGGALYVLRQDLFFRISVGGAGDVRSKLNRSKILARKVLQRL